MNISYILIVTEVADLVLVLRAKAGQEKLCWRRKNHQMTQVQMFIHN